MNKEPRFITAVVICPVCGKLITKYSLDIAIPHSSTLYCNECGYPLIKITDRMPPEVEKMIKKGEVKLEIEIE